MDSGAFSPIRTRQRTSAVSDARVLGLLDASFNQFVADVRTVAQQNSRSKGMREILALCDGAAARHAFGGGASGSFSRKVTAGAAVPFRQKRRGAGAADGPRRSQIRFGADGAEAAAAEEDSRRSSKRIHAERRQSHLRAGLNGMLADVHEALPPSKRMGSRYRAAHKDHLGSLEGTLTVTADPTQPRWNDGRPPRAAMAFRRGQSTMHDRPFGEGSNVWTNSNRNGGRVALMQGGRFMLAGT